MLLNPNINLINQITEVYEKLRVKQFKQSSQHKKAFYIKLSVVLEKSTLHKTCPFLIAILMKKRIRQIRVCWYYVNGSV